jgi:hypothetical protein
VVSPRSRDRARHAHSFAGPRPADQARPALRASFATQVIQHRFLLDAFGGDGQAQAVAQTDDRAHHRLRIGLLMQVAHEGLVDLDLGEGVAQQIAERAVAGAEIVHRYAHAQRADRCDHAGNLRPSFHQGRLISPSRRVHARRRQRLHHDAQQVGRTELMGETLTASLTCAGHIASRQALCSTNWPTTSIRPISSARPMNVGHHHAAHGWCQRTSAQHSTSPVARSISG